MHAFKSLKNFVLGLIMGGAIGTYFMNTKKGKKMQKEIVHKYKTVSKKVKAAAKKRR